MDPPGRCPGRQRLGAAAALTHGRGLVTVPALWWRRSPRGPDTARPCARQLGKAASAATPPVSRSSLYLAFVSAAGAGAVYAGEVTPLNSGAFNLRQFLSSVYQFYFPGCPR